MSAVHCIPADFIKFFNSIGGEEEENLKNVWLIKLNLKNVSLEIEWKKKNFQKENNFISFSISKRATKDRGNERETIKT